MISTVQDISSLPENVFKFHSGPKTSDIDIQGSHEKPYNDLEIGPVHHLITYM